MEKIQKNALTGIHWYDFVGTDYHLKDFRKDAALCDAIIKQYDGVDIVNLSFSSGPPGLTHNRYYVHMEAAKAILEEHGIDVPVLAFVMEAHFITFERDTVKNRAIKELYTRDVSDQLVVVRPRRAPRRR